MVKKVSAAEAKAKLSSLVAEVAFGGQHVVIERRGRPLAALVSMEDLERLERDEERPAARGALALVGAFRDVPEEEVQEFLGWVEYAYKSRELDKGRPVDLEV